MLAVYLLGMTAFAMAVVANVTGSWGAAFWAAALSPLTSIAAVYSVHADAQGGSA